MAPSLVEAAAEIVRQRTGLSFTGARRSAFGAGLAAAIRRSRVCDVAGYCARLKTEQSLLDDLVAEITVGETYFFREPQQLVVVREAILTTLRSTQSDARQLRVWSAGCATGEEPYSLAIMLREEGLDRNAHLVATDLSRAALRAARRGSYTRWSLRGVSDRLVHSWFQQIGDRFHLAAAVRDAVEFRCLNLVEDVYPSLATGIWGMDLVLCRNVLIYFDAQTVALVAERLLDSLSERGWLLLGASDPPLGDLVPCEVVVTPAGLAYRRPGGGPVRTRIGAAIPTREMQPVVEQPDVVSSTAPLVAGFPPDVPTTVVEPTADDRLPEATRACARHDCESAARLARQSVERDDRTVAAWVLLVRSLANRGELEAAGRACAAALDRHRDSPELVYLHAVILAEAGRPSEAATAARRALYLDRTLVVGHMFLGGMLARIGDTVGARRALRNAQRLLARLSPGVIVPASDGETAGRLAEIARVQLELLMEAVA